MNTFDVNSQDQQNDESNTQRTTKAASTKEQKKATHIRSEKNRRNQIRLGFESLTKTVPEIVQRVEQNKTKRGRGRMPLQGVHDDDESGKAQREELIRGGPVSEVEILTSTVDYLNELFSKREKLLTRLNQVQKSHPLPSLVAPPSGDALVTSLDSSHSLPIWQAKWDGRDDKEW